MRKESYVLIFGTIFSITVLIGLKITHFYVHGLCDCLSGKLYVYIIPFFCLVAVIALTNNTMAKLIKKRETEFHGKIKVSEEKYRELFETITDGIVFSDLERNIISCNKGFLDMLGYTMKEIVTKSCSDLTPLKWCDKDEKILQEQIIKRGYSDLYEKEYIRKDGKAFPVSMRGWTIKGKESKADGVWYVVRDITEHNRLEKNMRNLNNAIEQADEAVVITNIGGIIEYVNPAFERITGYSVSDAVGKNIRIVKSGKQSDGFYKEMWETITAGKVWRGNLTNRKRDGTFYDEEITITPVKEPDGSIAHFVANKRDITLQKQNEKEIKDLAKFPGEDPNPVLRVSKKGTILYANDASLPLLNFWGLEPDQLLPEYWYSFVLGVLRSNSSKNTEIECEDLVFSLTFAPVVESEYVNVYGLDITERKKMEEALLQSEKLKSMGIMASGVAHDFNNILAIVSGKVQLLKIGNKDNKELTDELSIIKRAADDGAKIASKMLKFTRTTKDTTGFVPFDFRDLINQAVDFTMPRWKNMAQVSGIDYHIDKESIKEVPVILCNPTELREVLINIINNSLDAMPDGGCISFRTWSSEDTVFISISDTGEGMPENVKKSIFDPFFTTKLAVGTGLGMSISYGIIIEHGGQIDVESEAGKGTTFTLQFPTGITTDSPKVSPMPELEIKSENLSILVVDDEENIRNILDQFLSMSGHKIKTVDNGAEAIELAKKEEFNLVLCDMAMPEVFGYDVIQALNELKKTPKIGIITGWGGKLKPLEKEGLEVDFIIKKPFDFSELTKHINTAFSR